MVQRLEAHGPNVGRGMPGVVFIGIFINQPKLLGKGIGSAVIRDLIVSVRKVAGDISIRLNVRSNNIRAIACYRKCGFVQISLGEKLNANGALIQTMTMQYSPIAGLATTHAAIERLG
jgi:RimJ/RimL family protein N-acetyltransferase